VKTNPFARLFAVLGVAVLVGVLLCSRDHRLEHQGKAAETPAGAETLSPSIESLSEAPAPQAAPTAKP
jgi:hypothetical protein